jgi:curved DNA-binding protein CbpA
MRKILASNVLFKFASTQFWSKYAKLLVAMSLEEAKKTLGFSPTSWPSPEEITKAYRMKAIENHPDRGGDPKKMVDINVAKDILDGKQRPYTQPKVDPSSGGSASRPYSPHEEQIKRSVMGMQRFMVNAKKALESRFPEMAFDLGRVDFEYGALRIELKGEQDPYSMKISLLWEMRDYEPGKLLRLNFHGNKSLFNALDPRDLDTHKTESLLEDFMKQMELDLQYTAQPAYEWVGPSFAEAFSQSGAPPSTEWKIVSNRTRTYSSGKNDASYDMWFMYGTLNGKHVFLAAKERMQPADEFIVTKFGPKTRILPGWEFRAIELPGSQSLSKIAAKTFKQLIESSWEEPAEVSQIGKLLFVLWPEGDRLSETTLKNHSKAKGLPLSKLLPSLEPSSSVKPGKSTVTVELRREYNTKLPPKVEAIVGPNQYYWRINSKETPVAESTILNGNPIRNLLWELNLKLKGDTINITNLRGGRFHRAMGYNSHEALTIIQNALTTEPSWVHIGIEAALEEIEAKDPKAKMASSGLIEAALYFGLSPIEIL